MTLPPHHRRRLGMKKMPMGGKTHGGGPPHEGTMQQQQSRSVRSNQQPSAQGTCRDDIVCFGLRSPLTVIFPCGPCMEIIAKDKPLGGKDPENINPQDA